MQERRRRYLIYGALAVAVVILLAFLPSVRWSVPSRPTPVGMTVPYLLCDPECNPDVRPGAPPVNEVDIAVNPKDPLNLIVGGNDYNTSTGVHWLGYYWTYDGGKTWSQNMLPGCPGCTETDPKMDNFVGSGDPALAYGPDGTLYYNGLASGDRGGSTVQRLIRQQPISVIVTGVSKDGGATFPTTEYQVASYTQAAFNDKNWIDVDQQDGTAYVVWVQFDAFLLARMLCSESRDLGTTWSTPVQFTQIRQLELQTQGATPIVGPDGTLIVGFIDYVSGELKVVRSSSGCSGFDAATTAAPVSDLPRTLPNNTYRTPTIPQGAADLSTGGHRGRFYLTGEDYADGNADNLLIYSDDGGVSWSSPIKVNNDNTTNDQFFGDVYVGTNSSVHMVWFDRRDDPNNVNLSVYYGQSTDGGDTFPIQFDVRANLTPGDLAPFDGNDAGETANGAHGHPLGDYIGIACGPDTCTMVWPDTRVARNGDGNTDIFAARVVYAAPDKDGVLVVPEAKPPPAQG